MNNDDYKGYLSLWNVPPNLSNQNFHNKFIRSLAISHQVEVVSVRPINGNFRSKTLHSASKLENNITWNYIKVSSSKVDKLINLNTRIKKAIIGKATKESIIFVDVLNRTLLKSSLSVAKKYGCKFDIVDLQHEYFETVGKYTMEMVRKGLTPNPDVMCNRWIKLGAF